MKNKQPNPKKLLVLKNDAARAAFLRDFKNWPLWVKVPKLQSKHYRYDLPDGRAIVASEYTSNFSFPVVRYDVMEPGKAWSPSDTSISTIVYMLRREFKSGI